MELPGLLAEAALCANCLHQGYEEVRGLMTLQMGDGAGRRITVRNRRWLLYILLAGWVLQDQGGVAEPSFGRCDECFCGSHCASILNLNVSTVACSDPRINLILGYRPSYKCINKIFIEKQKQAENMCPGRMHRRQAQCNYIGSPALQETITLVVLVTLSGVNLLKSLSG